MAYSNNSTNIIENPAAYEDAVSRRIKENANKTRIRKFHEEHADAEEILKFIEDQADRGNKFWRDIWSGVCEYGAPRPRIVEIARERLQQAEAKKAEWRARDAASQHVGSVGERIDFDAVCTFVSVIDNDFGFSVFSGYKDDAGNIYIHRGTRVLADKGSRVHVRATIKFHDERDGVKQNRISRPIIKEIC